jgi:uncharacterized membrane protein
MDYFQALDRRWTPLLVVCGFLLVVLGVVIRSLSARRSLSWRVGDAALYLGTVFLGFAFVFRLVLPFLMAKATRSLSGRFCL